MVMKYENFNKANYLNFHCLNDSGTHAFELATCGFELITRVFELLTYGFELVTCRFKLTSHGFKLVTCGLD